MEPTSRASPPAVTPAPDTGALEAAKAFAGARAVVLITGAMLLAGLPGQLVWWIQCSLVDVKKGGVPSLATRQALTYAAVLLSVVIVLGAVHLVTHPSQGSGRRPSVLAVLGVLLLAGLALASQYESLRYGKEVALDLGGYHHTEVLLRWSQDTMVLGRVQVFVWPVTLAIAAAYGMLRWWLAASRAASR